MLQDNSQVILDRDMDVAVFPDYHQLSNIIVRWDDKVLMLHRLTEPFKDFWSVPGGGVEEGEKYIETAVRELAEEVDLGSATLEPLYIFVDHQHRLESPIYSCAIPDGRFLNRETNEHDIVAWKEIGQVVKLKLTPGVRETLLRLSQLR